MDWISEETIDEYNASLTCRRVAMLRLDPKTTEQTIREFFSKFGQVVDVTVFRHRPSGISCCTGFLTYLDEASVEAVLRNDTGEQDRNTHHVVDGKRVIVQKFRALRGQTRFLPGFLIMNAEIIEQAAGGLQDGDEYTPFGGGINEHDEYRLRRQLEAYFAEISGDRNVRARIFHRRGELNEAAGSGGARSVSVRFSDVAKNGNEVALVAIAGAEVVIDGRYRISRVRRQYPTLRDGETHPRRERKTPEEWIEESDLRARVRLRHPLTGENTAFMLVSQVLA